MKIGIIFLLLLLTIVFTLHSEVQVGAIPALIYEYYDTPNLIYDGNGDEIEYKAISKVLSSITTQFIWKDSRNILLFNMEFFGSLGSLDGIFGKDGKLSGQIKADTFYQGYFKETPMYIKFGKYPAAIPFGFGTMVTTGQGELGFDSENMDFFYSGIFYNLFNKLDEDGGYEYVSETFTKDNIIINLLGANFNFDSFNLSVRLPMEYKDSNIVNSIYPSINLNNNFKNIGFNSFVGFAYRDGSTTWGVREEISINYYGFNTQILGAYLSGSNDITKNYNYTSIDNKYIEFHYGTHFNYLYQEAANIYGMNSVGLKQSWNKDNLNLWISGSSHFVIQDFESEKRDNQYVATIFSGGFKWNNLWSENTLFEVYTSLLKPEGFSVIDGIQTRDLGFQLVIKLHHIIF